MTRPLTKLGILLLSLAAPHAARAMQTHKVKLGVADIASLLKVRDSAFTSMGCEYINRKSGGPIYHSGWWGVCGDTLGVNYVIVDGPNAGMEPRAIWESQRFMAAVDMREEYPKVVVKPKITSPVPGFTPSGFGMWHMFRPISFYIGVEGAVKDLGERMHDGVMCRVIAYDEQPGNPESQIVLFWLDLDSTLLSLRTDLAVAARAEQSVDAPHIVQFGENHYDCQFTFLVESSKQVRPGVWMPEVARVRSSLSEEAQDMHLELLLGTLTIDDDVEVLARASFPADRWYFVRDEIERRDYTLGPGGNGDFSSLVFFREVAGDAAAKGLVVEPLDRAVIDFTGSSCGINAMAHVSWVRGGRQDPAGLLDYVPGIEREQGVTSLYTLSGMAEKLGMQSCALSLDAKELSGILDADTPSWVIAHFDRPSEQLPDHFALVRSAPEDPNAFIVTSPPFTSELVTRDVFKEAWSGNLLVLGDENITDIAASHNHERSWTSFAVGAIALVLGLAGISRIFSVKKATGSRA